ncbi:2-C-methyl-D-erythritol 4-phosphate cytidylyltransferase [Olivibacter ginsenosidimutans]|uniref:2-C-methyl-D-erythritol 4-phosphate cytidylyltransferase n=1 Tax=Olivibacter ginsenosidimutans TaxID=1176537 RepID=A0ABP9BJC2_9SPHI
MAKQYAIIVGGGTGTRMGSEVPKQFLPLNGLPVLMHTLAAFANCTACPTLVLVLNSSLIGEWNQLCKKHDFTISHTIIAGGPTRFHSVLNGLQHIKNDLSEDKQGYIAVHDGVRPLISKKIIDEGFAKVSQLNTSFVTAIPSKDSIRIRIEGSQTTSALDRTRVFLVQTPQFFPANILLEAYDQSYKEQFTDDASVVEQFGYPIGIIQGDTRNIKITFPEDLLLAEIMMKA